MLSVVDPCGAKSICDGFIGIMNMNKTTSAIFVIEDNGKDCVGHYSKEESERQDPSL